MDHNLVVFLVVVLSLITLTWLVIIAGALVIVWRMRKLIVGVTVAVRGVIELSRQLGELGRAMGEIKRGLEGRRAR